ncbi:MAG: MarR family winged helix-turn-helix transcriptional regulator [Candidatus Nanohaloarchaea archaeon]|nr:MarR family winged helix-turn-helix transcriptional regulator [Candidatus Nanohaloarchaea archaeon]
MLDGLTDLNVPRFYALAAIYHIGEEDIGRRRLADEIGLTESKTRTMLGHMRDAGLITAEETLSLAPAGEEVYTALVDTVKAVSEVDLSYFAVDEVCRAALLSGVTVDNEVAVRDEAIRGGATGMTVLQYDQQFRFPSEPDSLPERNEAHADLDVLDATFQTAVEGDVLFIVSADAEETVVAGLWRAIFSVMPV